jgi:hypothetical protein
MYVAIAVVALSAFPGPSTELGGRWIRAPLLGVAHSIGDELPGGAIAHEVDSICPEETAVWFPSERALAFAELNAALSLALSQLELAPRAHGDGESGVLRWSWRDAGERLDHVLWPVLRAAADLLASDESAQIRECGGEDCGWLYVDRSRNGLRRWCQMEVCGTKEKSRQRAMRRAEPG